MLTLNKIYCGDLLDIYKDIDNNSIDLIFADPPFNLGRSYGIDKDNRDNYIEWCQQWIDLSINKIKDGGVFIIHHIPKYAIILGNHMMHKLEFQNLVSWKTANLPIINRLLPENFSFLIFSKGKPKTFNRFGDTIPHKRCRHCNEILADWGGKKKYMKDTKRVSDVWLDIERIRHNKNKHRSHNELPIKIMERIIKIYTYENDIILDPFVGSGTTAVAAKLLNRNFIGIDISPDYVKISNERLNYA